jgi:hypothetical protein
MHGRKSLAKGSGQPPGFQEQSFRGPRIRLRQGEKLGSAFSGDDAGSFQKEDESLPGQLRVGRGSVDKVEAEPTAK